MSTQGLFGMDEKKAAVKLGVSVHTLRMWRHKSRGPVYARIGRRCVYIEKDLDAFLESCRIKPVDGA
uniref:Helix-turn-helix domain-containing protein n=1 Tax=Desulfovibrio sp. U5L TaxID=596152 RepID=I2PWM9_9BACT